jgi:toxin HigB-1
VIQSFNDKGTEDIFNGLSTRAARSVCPEQIWNVARRKLDMLNRATRLDDLKAPPNNQLEKLKDDRLGQHSIRINRQYRVCFIWTDQGPDRVEIADFH